LSRQVQIYVRESINLPRVRLNKALERHLRVRVRGRVRLNKALERHG
jgi:hypothetical protein